MSKLVYVQLYVQVSQCIWVDLYRPVWKLFYCIDSIWPFYIFSINLQGSLQFTIRIPHLPPIICPTAQ